MLEQLLPLARGGSHGWLRWIARLAALAALYEFSREPPGGWAARGADELLLLWRGNKSPGGATRAI